MRSGALRVDWPDNYKHKEPACERVLLPQLRRPSDPSRRERHLRSLQAALGHQSEERPDRRRLIVYIGVNVAAYIKDHPPRELTAEQREKIAEGQRLATRAAMMAGYVD